MNVVIAIDSFKGSLSSTEAGKSISLGIKKVFPDAECVIRPVADGGEGTVDALVDGMNGKHISVEVTGPLGNSVMADYGIVESKKLAVIEMSSAAGITLIRENERNPLNTTSYGVGEILKDAISRGCRKFLIGIGGSSTNDGGVGMLQALGYRFLDSEGNEVARGAKGLGRIASIDAQGALPELKECFFRVACDVKNPLCGENGCSYVYGPQKGADSEMIELMDKAMENYAKITERYFPNADAGAEGAGAAGGMGFAFLAYTNSLLEAGVNLIFDETELESYICSADFVITGEGRIDNQTVMGKAPWGVARLAKKHDKKVIAFCGCTTKDAGIVNEHGIDAYFPIIRSVESLDVLMDKKNAADNLSQTAEQVFRVIGMNY